MTLTRRFFVLGALGLPGCTALSSLNDAALPRDTYELQPVSVATDRGRSSRTLLVLEPTAPAAIATDRILIKQDPLSVTYLPDARWSDEVPQMVQSILIQSLAASGGLGFVGLQGAGPVPDTVLLTRIDAFGVAQRVLGTQRFAGAAPVGNDQADTIACAFQRLLDGLLPDAVAWVLARAA
jgi:cholesterol transport system auxiliary component